MRKFSNEEIIEGIKAHDYQVLSHIYDKNYKIVENLVLSHGGTREEAADVFQESMIIVYNKIRENQLTLTAYFDTYLYGVCRLVWRAQLRKKTNHVPAELVSERVTSDEDIQWNMIQNEKHQLVWHYFSKLTSDCQKVIRLFFEGKSIREITEIMNYSSEQHTKNRRLRCKERLINIIMKDPRFNELASLSHELKTKLFEN
ncbi:MAG: sigma-70 family RNA polymerase sigma factor [Bacteroidales bacterium]|nr:sigma-70 family RNA polymerase sigma factor [Bacteroidales bacterium]